MRLSEIAYFTADVQGMVDFYQRLLGSEPVARSTDMAIFLTGDIRIFIHKTYTPKPGELHPENHTAFAVEDVDQTCASLSEAGLTMEIPPANYYWGRSAYLRDPDGHLFEITKGASHD